MHTTRDICFYRLDQIRSTAPVIGVLALLAAIGQQLRDLPALNTHARDVRSSSARVARHWVGVRNFGGPDMGRHFCSPCPTCSVTKSERVTRLRSRISRWRFYISVDVPPNFS